MRDDVSNRIVEALRSIQRAGLRAYHDAVVALLGEVELLGARRVSLVTLDRSDLVHGAPVDAVVHARAREVAWGDTRVIDDIVFVPIHAHIRGNGRFPIAVLLAELDEQAIEVVAALAGVVGDTLVLARDGEGGESPPGMSNAPAFRRTTRRWAEIGRARGIPVSLLAIALDGLEEINQRIGFAAGDRAVDDLAAFLVRTLPEATACSRIGGAILAVLLAGVDGEQADAAATRIRDTFDHAHPLQLSIGVATLGALPNDDLLRAGHTALAEARRERCGVVRWSAALATVAPMLEFDLASGAEYQRILATWRLFEALCNKTQLDELVTSTLRALLPQFRADRVVLWHETEGGWAVQTSVERDATSNAPRTNERDIALVLEAVRTSKLVTIDDRTGVKAVALVVRNNDRIAAVLEVVHDTGTLRVGEADLAFLQAVAPHIGRVIGEVQAISDARQQQQETADRLRRQTIELRRLVRTSSGILGNDASMQPIFRMIERSRTSNVPLVITGETGTGKEAVARLVHRMSNRRGPFVVVDCGAIPAGLLESELFGHEKGAFTGAETRKIGHFEHADTGTIFLDEIGELPLDLQPKLLRVLQESTVRRLGGREVISVDFRLIAATHRNLAAMVEEGRFRQDLYFRLRVLEIELPPLRDRGDDILLLALHSVRQYSAETGREMMTISPEAEAMLRAYPWPGNVRELQNVLRRAVLIAPGDELTPKDLELDRTNRSNSARLQAAAARPGDRAEAQEEPLDEAVARWFWHTWAAQPKTSPPQDAIEAYLLRTSLRVAGGSIGQAAKRLDMHPETFVTHLERLGARESSQTIRSHALADILDRRISESTAGLRDQILRVLLTELLIYCRGNKSEMARNLGWGRQTLQRQLHRLGVVGRNE